MGRGRDEATEKMQRLARMGVWWASSREHALRASRDVAGAPSRDFQLSPGPLTLQTGDPGLSGL